MLKNCRSNISVTTTPLKRRKRQKFDYRICIIYMSSLLYQKIIT